ncbi:MAG TPA: sensor histidine kinase [Acidimicrobiales bacterium]|nr:sensor histidine kinase [Acidimicrobiales bacterium]
MVRPGALYAKVRDPHPVAVDVLVAVVCAGIGVMTELVKLPENEGYRDGTVASVVLALVATVPLVWRRTHPAAVMVVVASAMGLHGWLLFPGTGPFLGLLAALYAVAAYGSPRAARVSLAFVVGVQPIAVAHPDDPNFNSWGDVLVGVVIFTAVWVFGDSRRVRRLHLEVAEERAARAERERDERARAAVQEERTRIAREMHDIVAHSVSVMVVQAGAARRMVTRDPAAAIVATGEVEETGRAALRDMRRVIGVLRADGDEAAAETRAPAALEPQPGMADVAELVSTCRDAGLDVRVRTDGEVRALPSGVELAAYRIIQEALTNTMKHAGPARAEVRIAYEDDVLTVVVADDGRGVGLDADPDGTGHGLPGMRERVTVFGGDLDAGPHPGGGFRVRARLPLDRAAAPAGGAR